MAVRFIPVSICRVPATINGKHFFEATDDEIIAAINKQLSGHCEYRIQPLEREQIFVAQENPNVRCPARSPGGVTNDGTLPRKGAQCGLPEGHDGEHTSLVPTGAPWAKQPSLRQLQPKSPRQLARAAARVQRMTEKSNRRVTRRNP